MFTLIESRRIEERNEVVNWYRHDCGLQVISINSKNPENFAMLGFNTTPSDSTGVQHIIEHSILCGSKKYPVKELFSELVKTCATSFLNACTYPEFTVYPFASTIHSDYFNVFNVYWDSVFHSLVAKEFFLQEGWRYEISNGRLKRNGVVYSEMSSYYSESNTVVLRGIYKHLLGKSPLAHDSGGDPKDIPKLTYRKFLKYYREHYSPAKARLIVGGNIPEEEKLAFIEQHLQEEFPGAKDPGDVDFKRVKTPAWSKVRHKVVKYQPEDKGDTSEIVSCSWFIDDTHEPILDMTMQLLDYILTGNAGSPLTMALMESGLGDKTMSLGYSGDNLETYFHAGMRGVKSKADARKIFKLIDATLRQVVEQGISEENKISAFRQLLVDSRKITRYSFIEDCEDIYNNWIYGLNPFLNYDYGDTVKTLQNKLKDEPRYLENAIQKYLIDNLHRLELELVPDGTLAERKAKEDEAELDKLFASMSKTEKDKIVAVQKKLKKLQSKENTPEQLATLPKLTLNDFDPYKFRRPIASQTLANGLVLHRGEISGNGMAYINFVIDMSSLPGEMLASERFFPHFFNKVGNRFMTYDKVAEKTDYLGMKYQVSCGAGRHATLIGENRNYMQITFYGLEETLEQSLELLRQELTEKTFVETKRISQLLKALWSAAQSSISSMDNYDLCISRATTGLVDDDLNRATDMNNGGFSSLFYLKNLVDNLTPKSLDDFIKPMEKIAGWLKDQPISCAAMVCSDKAAKVVENFLTSFNYRKISSYVYPEVTLVAPATGRRENYFVNGVHSCARVFPAPSAVDNRASSLSMISSILSYGYLWDNIRVKNGAYGAFANYNAMTRTFTLCSSQDRLPNETYGIFDDFMTGVAAVGKDPSIVKSQVISKAGKICGVTYTPGGVCHTAVMSEILGKTEELVRRELENTLAMTSQRLLEDVESYFAEFCSVHNDCMIGPDKLKGFKTVGKIYGE